MAIEKEPVPTIFDGWHAYQDLMIKAIAPLDPDQLALRAALTLRSVGEIAGHVIAARARWFYSLMGKGRDEFKALGGWDRRGAKIRNAEELVIGLNTTWTGMHDAIAGWMAKDWEQTWPGESDAEPQVITRPWVIWHLIEHDPHHGGEISITLGAHGASAIQL
jgi:uncharacterized damage-inducible protein DinB